MSAYEIPARTRTNAFFSRSIVSLSGIIRGIDPSYAGKMVKAFGEKVFDIIEAEPDRLREVDGIGPIRAQRITAAWAEQKIVREIMVFLHSHGVGTARAVRIYKTYSPTRHDPPFAGHSLGCRGKPRHIALQRDRCERCEIVRGAKALSDKHRDVGVSLGDCSEHLPTSAGSFDIADAHLHVTFALFAAADERRIHADSDQCCRSCWLVRGCNSKLRADPQRMVAQCLRAPTGVNG